MGKKPKLRMTNADYVAIAVSPALIMALVGSLVFFLIEVLYVGQYQARLMYVFALFVFAAVLIGRIAIEMGSDRAALFALPLGVAMFLVLAKFVEHASPYSHLINLTLMAVIWWSAHKLTWDCTLIDDSKDASGQGLMQHVGADDLASTDEPASESPPTPTDNELLAEQKTKKKTPHTPGLWVLYFSLAALPLFGIGQKWIPASDVARRQYAFGLLTVYVAAGLTLLVTTSFLGLRRYLRQRRVEMPTPMAATWVVTGALLIGIVMLLAALIPRPHAEYAISQVPWQANSPQDLASSRMSVGNDGTEDETADEDSRKVDNGESDPNASVQREGENPTTTSDQGDQQAGGKDGQQNKAEDSGQGESGDSGDGGEGSDSDSDAKQNSQEREFASKKSSEQSNQTAESSGSTSESQQSEDDSPASDSMSPPPHAETPSPPNSLPDMLPSLGGLTGILKLLLYAVLTVAILYLAWRNREAIAKAFGDILRMIQEFFGGKRANPTSAADGEAEPSKPVPVRPFASYADPFASGKQGSMEPKELVRYTFEAFEAWSRERGRPRRPDQTPVELVRQAVPHESPMLSEALRLARLYNEAAYSPQTVSPAPVEKLARLWSMMRASTETPVESGV